MSKSSLDELLEVIDRCCDRMDRMANNDRKFCAEMQIALEQYSVDLYRSSAHLKELKQLYGEVI